MFPLLPDHPLAQPILLCLLPSCFLLPCHVGRHAVWSHRLHWILLGNKCLLWICIWAKTVCMFSPYLYANNNLRFHLDWLVDWLIDLYILGACFQAASPACTELETVMLDWLGKMLQLPEYFLAGTHGHGGGVIQVSVFCVNSRLRTSCINMFPGSPMSQTNFCSHLYSSAFKTKSRAQIKGPHKFLFCSICISFPVWLS